MAKEALVHIGMLLASDRFGHHLKMPHVVTRRRLMALCAVAGRRRRVEKSRHAPRGRLVTSRTVAAE